LVHQCAEEFSKSKKMGRKFVRTTSTIYKRVERKLLPQHFTPCIVDVHPYTKYFVLSLQGATKNCQVRTGGRWYQKRTVGPTFVFVRTESERLLSRAIFKNVLRDFYRG